jgi:ElaB/YqjD/DUF883 family membrane-anchored ribosome-binding protein
MTTTAESTTMDQPTYRERVAEAMRGAAELSRDARTLKTLAADAVEDGLHTARRTVKKARQRALDTRDDLTYRIKRQPLMAVAIAFGAGALAGLIVGWVRPCARANEQNPDDR